MSAFEPFSFVDSSASLNQFFDQSTPSNRLFQVPSSLQFQLQRSSSGLIPLFSAEPIELPKPEKVESTEEESEKPVKVELEQPSEVSESCMVSSDSEPRKSRRDRSDLPCKAVIRAFRKTFTNFLSVDTGYILKKRSRGKEFYRESLAEIIDKHTDLDPSPSVVFYLGALLYPKDAKSCLEQLKPASMDADSANREIDRIHRFRSVYTHRGMKEFCRIPEIAKLFSQYADSQPQLPALQRKSLAYMKKLCAKSM